MASTRSSITRFLRAAVSHRNTITTLLRPHHNLHRPLHTFTPTSPLSFLRSRPSNLPISNLHFFSTSRRVVHPRATESKLLSFLSSTTLILLEGAVKICVDILFISVCVLMWCKYGRSSDDEMWSTFKGSLPEGFRKEQSVVFRGYFKLMQLLVVLVVLVVLLLTKYYG